MNGNIVGPGVITDVVDEERDIVLTSAIQPEPSPEPTLESKLTPLMQLTQEQRTKAADNAAKQVMKEAGNKPSVANYRHVIFQKFSPDVRRVIWMGLFAVAFAFFSLSAIRLYSLSEDEFGSQMDGAWIVPYMAVMVVVGAEAGALTFITSAGMFPGNRAATTGLWVSALACMGIALVGNIEFTLGDKDQWYKFWEFPWVAMEAVIPPTIVITVGYIMERMFSASAEANAVAQVKFLKDLGAWETKASNPQEQPSFIRYYAIALKDMLSLTNRKGRASNDKTSRVALLDSLGDDAWRWLVQREMNAADWTLGLVPTEGTQG